MDQVSFFQRRQIQQRIEKRVAALEKGYRQNVGIVGMPGAGKTHLLTHLYQVFSKQTGIIPVYVHAQSLGVASFAERWAGALLAGLFAGQSVQPAENLNSLLKAADPIVPRTVEKIRQVKKLVRKDKNVPILRELFALSGVLAEETGQKLILMLDEFQELEALPVSDAFELLGKEIMVETNTLYLVASSMRERAQDIFHHKLSLLFGNFEVIKLDSLGFEEVSEYLESRFPDFVISPVQKDFMIRMTDGHLLYLDLLADRLEIESGRSPGLARHGGQAVKTLSDMQWTHVFLQELIDEKGRIWLWLDEKVQVCRNFARENPYYLKALLAIAHGRRKCHAVAAYIERKIPETKKILHKLVQEEIIGKKGSFYHLGDPLFCFWLREVFEYRETQFQPEKHHLLNRLHHALTEEFAKGQLQRYQDVPAQIEKLFKEFRNDIVELDGKKISCPQFTEVTYSSMEGRAGFLTAKNAKVRWISRISKDSVTEEDILYFLEESKRYRRKIQKKIVIALAGIEQNAKLMAQEAKIQLWDLRLLNTLMDLYHLPKLIVIPDREDYGSNVGAVASGIYSPA